MKKMKVSLVGAKGKMGGEILGALKKRRAGICEAFTGKVSSVDIVIDFSSPDGMSEALRWSVKNGVPFLSGTTGLSDKQNRELMLAAKKIPIFWASNFSMGIALVTEMLKVFSEQYDYDFQIEELHHRNKKDKPSGTAKSLQAELKKIVKKELPEPLSIRGGEIFGIHKIWAMRSTESICIEHSALNRSVFAEGALQAASWLLSQKPGFYTMRDFLAQRK